MKADVMTHYITAPTQWESRVCSGQP